MHKPVALRDGLTARYEVGEDPSFQSLCLAEGDESIDLYESELTIVLKMMGRGNILRLLGESELPVGRPWVPPSLGNTEWAGPRKPLQDEELPDGLVRILSNLKDRILWLEGISTEERLQRLEGLLGQALGRIEGLQRWEASCKTRPEDNL